MSVAEAIDSGWNPAEGTDAAFDLKYTTAVDVTTIVTKSVIT